MSARVKLGGRSLVGQRVVGHGRPSRASLTLTLALALSGALLGLTASQAAHADDTTPATSTDASTATAASSDSKWKIGVGPGLVVTPKYPGSRQLSYIPFPALDISYDDRFFSQGPDVLGVNVLRGPAYHLGAALSFDFQSRKESDDPRLHGLGNVDGGPKLKLFGDYTWWAFTGSVALYQDIAGHHQGTTISTDLVASAPVGGWLFSVGPGFTWANGTYTRTFFGVSQQQSAASGLPTYNTSAGIRDIHMNAMVTYDFSRHWNGSVAATFGRLEHNAANSPITEKRFELNTLASVNYKF
ncbi:MipA/OmpV family protein [Paraburkholderia bryophila]|uniref:Outer membrane scaffolding protein for murein synthesis (MipA/OmpV family) n=1 Tax=Paraburkholderia bryophila TaxID=420952 RepID=A0A7Y9W9V5_9BURK|nr:MipA/OmpV family protein [Paraburkholderia bryophila]NYH16902.1 outer membrane scaffolding protein for murein synthesis (MipA/OmpV family) [Paraburkholderia bryophila]